MRGNKVDSYSLLEDRRGLAVVELLIVTAAVALFCYGSWRLTEASFGGELGEMGEDVSVIHVAAGSPSATHGSARDQIAAVPAGELTASLGGASTGALPGEPTEGDGAPVPSVVPAALSAPHGPGEGAAARGAGLAGDGGEASGLGGDGVTPTVVSIDVTDADERSLGGRLLSAGGTFLVQANNAIRDVATSVFDVVVRDPYRTAVRCTDVGWGQCYEETVQQTADAMMRVDQFMRRPVDNTKNLIWDWAEREAELTSQWWSRCGEGDLDGCVSPLGYGFGRALPSLITPGGPLASSTGVGAAAASTTTTQGVAAGGLATVGRKVVGRRNRVSDSDGPPRTDQDGHDAADARSDAPDSDPPSRVDGDDGSDQSPPAKPEREPAPAPRADAPGTGTHFASGPDEVREAWSLVHDVYVRGDYISPNANGVHAPPVVVASNPRVIVRRDSDGEVDGTITIIPDHGELPLDSVFRRELDVLRSEGREIAEAGLFATRNQLDPNAQRGSAMIRDIYDLTSDAIAAAIPERSLSHAVIGVHPHHVGFYKKSYGAEQVGDVLEYGSVNNRQVVLLVFDLDRMRMDVDRIRTNPDHRPSAGDARRYRQIRDKVDRGEGPSEVPAAPRSPPEAPVAESPARRASGTN